MKYRCNGLKTMLFVVLALVPGACGEVNHSPDEPRSRGPQIDSELDDASLTTSLSEHALAGFSVDQQALGVDLSYLAGALTKLDSSADAKLADLQHAAPSRAVRFADIKEWQAVGMHYAAGYNADKHLLALYDLTYLNTASIPFVKRSLLGTIGVGGFSLADLIQVIRDALAEHKNRPRTPTGSAQEEVWHRFLDENESKIYAVIDRVGAKHASAQVSFDKGWWARLPWKNPATQSRTSFRLSDIDISAMIDASKVAEFTKRSTELSKIFAKEFGVPTNIHLLDMFEFAQRGDGSFEVFLNQDSLPTIGRDAYEPMKVIDFVRYQKTAGHAIAEKTLAFTLGKIAGLIPEPTVANLLKYAVGRWFYLYQQQQAFHHLRVLEYLNRDESGSQASPLAFLNREQRTKAAIYILSHQAHILDTIFNRPNEATWLAAIAAEQNAAAKNQLWAQANQFGLIELSPLYYLGERKSPKVEKRLFAFGAQRFISASPFTAIDYQRPRLEWTRRNVLKGMDAALNLIEIPVPLAKQVLQALYGVLVMNDIKKAEGLDARLVSHLYAIDGRQGPANDHHSELGLLYHQRNNPFEFRIDDEGAHVDKARQYIGLPATE